MRLLSALGAWTAALHLLACPDAVAAKKSKKAKKPDGGKEEMPTLEEMGKLFMPTLDKDGDGFMSEAEFEQFGGPEGKGPGGEKFTFKSLDKNGDGKIDTDEAGGLWKILMPDAGAMIGEPGLEL